VWFPVGSDTVPETTSMKFAATVLEDSHVESISWPTGALLKDDWYEVNSAKISRT
jgi:hypothetical protein